MKNLLHSLLLPAALLLAGGAANIPERSTFPAAGVIPRLPSALEAIIFTKAISGTWS
jgi:hypothetical protein